MEIELPSYDWFTAEFDKATGLGNCWSGSRGTDPKRGGLSTSLFEYTVTMKKNEDKSLTLTATHWVRPPWPALLDRSCAVAKTFDGSQAGIDEAAAWLSDAFLTSGVR